MAFLVASASEALGLVPATVPIATFSSIASAAPLVSLMAPTLNSLTSLMPTVKLLVLNEPSEDVARTTTIYEAPSASRLSTFAVRTVPSLPIEKFTLSS